MSLFIYSLCFCLYHTPILHKYSIFFPVEDMPYLFWTSGTNACSNGYMWCDSGKNFSSEAMSSWIGEYEGPGYSPHGTCAQWLNLPELGYPLQAGPWYDAAHFQCEVINCQNYIHI